MGILDARPHSARSARSIRRRVVQGLRRRGLAPRRALARRAVVLPGRGSDGCVPAELDRTVADMAGMSAVDMPPIVRAWTQNFQWSMGIVYVDAFQRFAT